VDVIARLVPAGKCRLWVASACALAVLSAAAALVPPLILYVIAIALIDRTADPSGLSILQLVFLAIASVVLRIAFLVFARVTAGQAAIMVTRSVRAQTADKIGTLPLGTLAESRPGDFETMLLEDVGVVAEFISERLVELTCAVAMLVLAFAIACARDWRAACAGAALVAAAAVYFAVRASAAGRRFDGERAARDTLGASVFHAVRAAAPEQSLPPSPSAHPVSALAQAYDAALRPRFDLAASLRAQRRAFGVALPAVVVVGMLWFGGQAVDVAAVFLFAALGVRISGALSTTLVAGTWIAPARAGARRILALLAIPSTASGTEEPAGPPSLRFSHVAFSYGGSASGRAAVLRDVDFLAQAAAVTAIVGPSGAGKTTITRLAARFWDADGGAVEFAGVDVRKTPLDWLMRQISFVFQDVTLLDDTIAANLRLAQPDATDDDLVRAATAAAAHGFISALPEGYKTLVGDRGLRISRGERQRLQLARAFLKDAPVLILDEPTSSLDPATEGEVYEALATFAKGKTVLVVTHRLATIASADSIVVLGADGTVSAQGTHAQLLATSPLYAALWEDYHAAIDVAATAQEAPAR
jgi:ATP-binding cassette subfamily B protein